MNGYNNIVKGPTVIQPVPQGQDEVVTFDCPPVVEYASHWPTIEELEAYYGSLKYVPIQRPSENFIFTESADNYMLQTDSCPYCGRFFPSGMSSLDRGRHSFKICPCRPVKCGVTGKVMMAKDYLYLHMWTLGEEMSMAESQQAGVWAWTNAVKRDRELRREAEERAMAAESFAIRTAAKADDMSKRAMDRHIQAEESIYHAQRRIQDAEGRLRDNQDEYASLTERERGARERAEARALAAEQNARSWEEATESVARREKLSLLEMEQRMLMGQREKEEEAERERELVWEAMERERNALEESRREQSQKREAEERARKAEYQSRVWEEAADVLAKREQELMDDTQQYRRRISELDLDTKRERASREMLEDRAKRAEEDAERYRGRSDELQKNRDQEKLSRDAELGDQFRQLQQLQKEAQDAVRRAQEQAAAREKEAEDAQRREREARAYAENVEAAAREYQAKAKELEESSTTDRALQEELQKRHDELDRKAKWESEARARAEQAALELEREREKERDMRLQLERDVNLRRADLQRERRSRRDAETAAAEYEVVARASPARGYDYGSPSRVETTYVRHRRDGAPGTPSRDYDRYGDIMSPSRVQLPASPDADYYPSPRPSPARETFASPRPYRY